MRNSKSKKSPSEASIVKACVALIRARGGCVIKTTPPGVPAGTPDLIACIAGRFYAIEVKRPGEKPTALQEYRLAQWRKAGAVAVWVDSADALVFAIRE
jgi:Holliday junction resolvase